MYRLRQLRLLLFAIAISGASVAPAQLSNSAYRVLGQPDLRQNGINLVQGVELFSPLGVAIDATGGGQVHIYISDTANSRVLAWQDAQSYQIGEPPNLVLGQPGPQFSQPNGIGPKGFNAPLGLAVDPRTGNLYVADFGNNRVLRFTKPFENPSRAEPDAVYGQPGFTSTAPGVARNLMNGPRAVTFDSLGNLWVADTGNHRVLRFSSAVLDDLTPPDADTVIGQADSISGGANRTEGLISAAGFNTPAGLVFDAQNNLYVADFNNNRILKFSAPLGPTGADAAASDVIGQPGFGTNTLPPEPTSSTLAGPTGLGVDGNGNLYAAVANDNRVLVFALAALASGAHSVFGQSEFRTTEPNVGVFPKSSPNTLFGPADVEADPNGNVYVADTGNNRVLGYPAGSKSATRVWGQTDFSSNGPNQVKPGSMNRPFKVAVDYTQTPHALYVSDTSNHRVLVWKDAVKFRDGDPADLVIGQPDLRTAIPNVDTRGSESPTATSLSSPAGIQVDPRNGNLFVADSGNNRVLRFPRPVSQTGRITANAVVGQVNFTSSVSAVVSASSLRAPTELAFGPDGNLFVADTGNNRILEFDSVSRPAIRVYGQPNFTSSVSSPLVSAQTLSAPQGLYVDSAFNLYVADTGANRVLIFPDTQAAPVAGMAASFVVGQPRFDTTAGGAGTTLNSPTDVSVDRSARVWVADNGHHRILEFPSLVFLPIAGATAVSVVGQRDLFGIGPNWNSTDGLATPQALSSPVGIYFDRQGTLYVADSGNNRVLHFLKPAVAVNAATYQGSVPVAQGGLVALFGVGITEKPQDAAVADRVPWPTTLLNRQVVIDDEIVAPMYYIGSTQVNFQLPTSAPTGSDRIAIRTGDTGELIAGGSVLVARTSPGLFTASQDGQGQGAILNQNNTLNSSANPAARGSVISLYGTGQGQVTPAVPDGTAAPSNPLSVTVSVPTTDGATCVTSPLSMCVAIGSAFAEVQYSGLAPGFVGLWQINIKIPEEVVPGAAVPMRVVINGAPTNIVTAAIQ